MTIVAYDFKVNPSDIINDGNCGFLIPPDKVDKLKDTLEFLIEEPGRFEKMSQQAYTHSKE